MITIKSLLLTSAALVLIPAAAAAQTTDTGHQPGASAAAPVASVAEVVVTANRRSQNLQTVPLSVTAVRGEVLKTQNIQSAIDLTALVPGFTVARNLGSATMYLRGVGTSSSGYTTETPVAVYIDGLYLPNSASAVFGFNNIEQIEVLKGPQGTLYGRNTTGGLISVTTRDPGQTRSLDVSAGYANYNTPSFNAYGSTPITDTLAANFAASYVDQMEGWGHNIFTGTNNLKFKDTGFEGKLLWQPTSSTKITLAGFYDNLNTDQGLESEIYPGEHGIDGTPNLGKYVNSSDVDAYLHQEQYHVSLKVQQDVGFARLTSLTGYINNQARFLSATSGIPGGLAAGQYASNLLASPARSQTFSQELQLSSKPSSSPFEWIAGLYYYHDNSLITADSYVNCTGVTAASCAPKVSPALYPASTTGRPLTRSAAGFGEGTYKFTPSTRLTVGVRYTQDTKLLSGVQTEYSGRPDSIAFAPFSPGQPYTVAGVLYPGIATKLTNSEPTYRAVLAQDLTSDSHAYVSYNRGFRSGSYNPTNFKNPPALPEVMDAYAGGVKSYFFDHMLRLNTEAFYYDYKDVQLRTNAPPAPPGGTILYNAAEEHIKGVDADFAFAPTRALSIVGGLEYLDAKYSNFPGGTCSSPAVIRGAVLGGDTSVACNLTGHTPPNAPTFSFNLGATYTLETEIGAFAVNANDSYKSSQYWDPDNRIKEAGYHVANASVTWTGPASHYSAELFVKNIGQAYYYADIAENTGADDTILPGPPRTYGLTLRYRY